MNLKTHSLSFANQDLVLTNKRAIYWSAQSLLILSDLHLGKASHFRKNGIAIPTTVNDVDLQTLERLILHFNPKKILFVGDLIHSKSNKEVVLFKDFISKHSSVEFLLVKGNHDRVSATFLQQLGISKVVDALEIDGIIFSHEPTLNPKQTVICGHIHPGIRIILPNKKALRMPCFVVAQNQIILPAFSLFTGLDTQMATNNASFYAFDDNDFYIF